jgi:hypothetical protein
VILGAAAGLLSGAATTRYTGFMDPGVCVGALVAITVWFWAWGTPARVESGGRRG